MRPWLAVGLTVGSVVIQSSLLDKVTFRGVKPELVILAALVAALLYGPRWGLGVGLAGGFLLDIIVSQYVGLHMLAYGLVGLSFGFFEPHIWKGHMLVPLLAGLLGTVMSQLLVFSMLFALGHDVAFRSAWHGIIAPVSLYNMVLAPLLYWLIWRVWARHEPDQSPHL